MSALCACVVVPARDEEELIGACIAALAAQDGVREATRTRSCSCSTAAPTRPRQRARAARGRLRPARDRGRRAPASATPAARAWTWPRSCLPPDGLIATTDADSEPAPDWLRAQLDAVAAGARAIGGRVEVGAHDLPPAALRRREADAVKRHAALVGAGAREHHQFSGASLARHRRDLRAGRPARAARRARGRGLRARAAPPRRADRAARRRARHDLRAAHRPRPPRARGRPAAQQLARRAQLPRERLHASSGCSKPRTAAVSVILPTREVAGDAAARARRARAAAAR